MVFPAGKPLTVKEELQHILREAIRGKIIDDEIGSEISPISYYIEFREALLEEWMQLLWPAISKSFDIEHEQTADLTNDWWLSKLKDVCLDCAAKHNYL